MTEAALGADRIDKWLWRARFFKTRSLAAKAVADGLLVNGRRIDKPGLAVRPGDVLTFVQGSRVRVVEILALGDRRGPAPEAQSLYADRSTPKDAPDPPEAGTGRPDSRERRALAALRRREGP
jgi:ribosome-associated heat shock protein Hsp15